MFAELSPVWRKRLVLIVAVWAAVLVAAAFLGRQATVAEQADAAEGRRGADEAVGVAASALAGSAFHFAVGPAVELECEITPVRDGVDYIRTFEVDTDEPELAFQQAAAALADHLDVEGPTSAEHWRRTASGTFLTVALHVDTESDGPPLQGSVSTGCRPKGADFGTLTPPERAAKPGSLAAYARIECANGGFVETWWWSPDGDRLLPQTTADCD